MEKYDNEFSLTDCLMILANPITFFNFLKDGVELLRQLKRIVCEEY
jgi:hypothetical protein